VVLTRFGSFAPFRAGRRPPRAQFATDAESRRRVQAAQSSRCAGSNGRVLEELVRARHEAAVLLGFESHAHLMTQVTGRVPRAW
jgi:Zn-dependent oligopeptidase